VKEPAQVDATVSVGAALSAASHRLSDCGETEYPEAQDAGDTLDQAAELLEAAIAKDVPGVKAGGRGRESDAQGKLMQAKDILHLLDSSSKGSVAMAFQPPRDMYDFVDTPSGPAAVLVPNVYTLSARPDATHAYLPVLLEIKPNKPWALLQQAISRVYVLRTTAAYYTKIVAFAAHPKIAWVVHYSRSGADERIDVIVISVASVLRLWLCLQATYPRIEQWLSSDGPLILTTLTRLGLRPRSTLVFHIAHGVYGVSTVKHYQYDASGGGPTGLGARHLEPHFCVKVHTCRARYVAEATALCSIYKSLTEEKRKQFYVHRLLNVTEEMQQRMPDHCNDEKALVAQAEKIRHRFGSAPPPATYTFAAPAPDLGTYIPQIIEEQDNQCFAVMPGGCIIMKHGTPIPAFRGKTDARSWLTAVTRSLGDIHAAGYLHCDLRKSNTMLFEGNVHVIDFDLSVPAGEDATVELERDSGQWNDAGVRVADICLVAPIDCRTVQVTWTAADDIQMATEALLQLSFPE
jgi:hypothetical protein